MNESEIYKRKILDSIEKFGETTITTEVAERIIWRSEQNEFILAVKIMADVKHRRDTGRGLNDNTIKSTKEQMLNFCQKHNLDYYHDYIRDRIILKRRE